MDAGFIRVSIRTRPTGRVMRGGFLFWIRDIDVSIRTRPTGRVMPLKHRRKFYC